MTITRRKLRRWLAGGYYFGCFAPFGFGLLTLYILVDGLLRLLRLPRRGRCC